MSVYEEPLRLIHRAIRLAPSPDPHRPGFVDPRVVETACGRVIALTGHPKHRPAELTLCPDCPA